MSWPGSFFVTCLSVFLSSWVSSGQAQESHDQKSDSAEDAVEGAMAKDAAEDAAEDAADVAAEEAIEAELTHMRCPQLCGQHEACINMRCLSTCRPACAEGSYCTPSGECRKRQGPTREVPTEAELQSRHGEESARSQSAAVLDVGGFLGLGVRPTYEWGAMHSYHLRYQVMSTGLMSHQLETQTEFERFDWGFGAWFGYRRYEAKWGNLRGFFYGGGLGYSAVHVRDNERDVVGATTHYVIPYGEFGYRWVFGKFLFGFGPSVAVRFPFLTHFNSLGEDSCATRGDCARNAPSRFEGTMTVEIGLML